jgi:hypothetical protein
MLELYNIEICLAEDSLGLLNKNFHDLDESVLNQCTYEDEVRNKEITRALGEIESGAQFAFYNLDLSKEDQRVLSEIEIDGRNNQIINGSYLELKKLKQEVQKALSDMKGVNITEYKIISNLIMRVISMIMGELKSEEFELKIRSIKEYSTEEDCIYWHIDKNQEKALVNAEEALQEKRFLMVLKGKGTLYKEINEEQREEFRKIANEGPAFYGHGITKCRYNDAINQLFNNQETIIAKKHYGSVHKAGYEGAIHSEPKESESRLILLLTPRGKVL